jgi:hypothetical protein
MAGGLAFGKKVWFDEEINASRRNEAGKINLPVIHGWVSDQIAADSGSRYTKDGCHAGDAVFAMLLLKHDANLAFNG